MASADQQKAAGTQQEHDEENDEDVAMETEDQEDNLQATDIQELKPEQLDSTKASQKGTYIFLCSRFIQDSKNFINPRWKLFCLVQCSVVLIYS